MGKGHIFGTPVPSVTSKNFHLQKASKQVFWRWNFEEHEVYFHARGIVESEKTCFETFWRWKFFDVTEGTGVPKMWPLPIYDSTENEVSIDF